ncbi:hypothetical protein GCM10009753_53030 [Streptantibioticus ferralitis]
MQCLRERNDNLTLDEVAPKANLDAWRRCLADHELQERVAHRSGSEMNGPGQWDGSLVRLPVERRPRPAVCSRQRSESQRHVLGLEVLVDPGDPALATET